MKLAKVLVLIVVAVCFTNCTIKERIVFNEDGSGNYLLNYNMAEFMKQMQSQMGASASAGNKEAIDTVWYLRILWKHTRIVWLLYLMKNAKL